MQRHALSIIVLTLCVIFSGNNALASWSQQSSSWSSSDPDERRVALSSDARQNISPFTPGSNNLALDVGQVFLLGDLRKYSDSIGSQIHYTYGVSDLFGFDSSFGYSEHSDGNFSMLTLLTGLRTNLSWYDKVVPYFIFGLGFYKPSYQQSALLGGASGVSNYVSAPSISPVLFGVHLGPGVDLELTKQLFYAAAITFHDVFGATRLTAAGTPIDAGGTFTSFLLHTGVTF
ncbi:MAG: hypothetical protein AABZ06_11620 [Bdellovibrionota bacterium]